MEEIHAKAVQILLSRPERHIPEFSDHFGIPDELAKDVRTFWNRALVGRCAVCGTPTKGAKRCRTCKRKGRPLIDNRSSIALLRGMDPNRPGYQVPCSRCGSIVWWSAAHVLHRCRRFGFFKPPEEAICAHCRNEERRRPVGLTHRPFEELIRDAGEEPANKEDSNV